MVTGDNPFVKFKNYVDTKVNHGISAICGPFATSSTSPPPPPPPPPSHSNAKSTHINSHSSSPPPTPATMVPSSNKPSNAGDSEHHPATIDDIHTWAINSPYSPLNLQHLPQPTPRDPSGIPFHLVPTFMSYFLPSDSTPHPATAQFTFRDAFEDLLIAASGEPLPSIFEIPLRNILGPLTSPSSSRSDGGLYVGNWVMALEIQGRWDAYFHRHEHAEKSSHLYFRPLDNSFPERRALVGWDEQNQHGLEPKGIWDAVWKMGMEIAGEGDDVRGRKRKDGRDREMQVKWREDANANANASGAPANVEEELYGVVRSPRVPGAKEVEKGWTPPSPPPRKMLPNVAAKLPPPIPTSGNAIDEEQPSTVTTTTTVHSDGSKLIKTVKRRTEKGKTETTTTSQHFDSRGYMFSESRETSTTRDWSGRLPGDPATASVSSWSRDGNGGVSSTSSSVSSMSREKGSNDGGKNGGEGGKGGWFW